MEALKSNITINKRAAMESTQIMLEGDIILSDNKPDIEKILETSEYAYIESKETGKGRISFKGRLDIEVLYGAKDSEKKVHCMNSSAEINDFINIDGIDEQMYGIVKCDITNVDYSIVNDRKINYKAICQINAEIIKKEETEIVSDIEGLEEKQIKRQRYKTNILACCAESSFTVKDEIVISGGRPNIDEILGCRIIISSKEAVMGKDKADISGVLKLATIYRSDEEANVINFIENEIPFNGSVDADGGEEGMTAECLLCIEEKKIEAAADDDGEKRVIDAEIKIKCSIKGYEEKEIELFEDGYCINKIIETERENIEYSQFICHNKNQFPVKDIVQLDDESESILQIIKASGNVYIDEIRIIEDKVIAEGIIRVNILYAANNDENPVCCYNAIIPYKQTIEAKGAENGDVNYVNIDMNAEHISVNMVSDKEVEVRCVISFDTYVFEERRLEVVTGILFEDIDKEVLDKIPGMVIYVVQKGDTLWRLAKKYNTSVEEIAEINGIENPDLIYPNQKLLILKRVE